jgi:hypothetical protein
MAHSRGDDEEIVLVEIALFFKSAECLGEVACDAGFFRDN